MTLLHQLTLSEAREALMRGEITSVELTDALLARIAAVEPQVRAFLTIDAEGARAQAQAADARRAAGDTSPLLGIPLGIKDVISTQGCAPPAPRRCSKTMFQCMMQRLLRA